MIIKEFDEKKKPKDPRLKAGYKAEKQMAFYLKREFQNSENIFVLNDVRVQVDDDKAQIDHLIVYPAGVVLVESKSVSGEITIDSHGGWVREWRGKREGMPSAIIQAENQSKVLKRYLVQQSDLLEWSLPNNFKYDVFAAISDQGIINREYEGELNELCKADQIVGRVKELAADRLKIAAKSKIKIDLGKEIALNLNGEEKVNKVPSEVKENTAKYTPNPAFKCSECDSKNLQILYGRYGYYFKCSDCEGNTPLKPFLKCVTSKCKPKIRKSKEKFYKECPSCETSVLFFRNKKENKK